MRRLGNAGPLNFLMEQARLPKSVLSNTPLAALGDSLTGVMSNIASALPAMPSMAAPAGMTQVASFFKGIEASLPEGVPKISDLISPPAAEAPPTEIPALGNRGIPPAPRGLVKLVFE